jgi:phage terminase large subunit-like protein
VHVRLFRELRLWVPRKNGKSEFLAALALLFWAIEGQRRGAGFCFAHDESQAREVFDKMGDMIAYAPNVFRSPTPASRSRCSPNSSGMPSCDRRSG